MLFRSGPQGRLKAVEAAVKGSDSEQLFAGASVCEEVFLGSGNGCTGSRAAELATPAVARSFNRRRNAARGLADTGNHGRLAHPGWDERRSEHEFFCSIICFCSSLRRSGRLRFVQFRSGRQRPFHNLNGGNTVKLLSQYKNAVAMLLFMFLLVKIGRAHV